MVRRLPDKFIAGFVSALFLSMAFYFFIEIYIAPLGESENLKKFLAYPRPYLYVLAIQAILLRIFMINYEKESFSKGWILGVFIFALYIFYGIQHLKHV